jgi:glycosyltransferase involved in cell wall biosynthesis
VKQPEARDKQPERQAAERSSGPKIATDGNRIQPLVSIITPTYNRAGYLAETIDSVLGQDHPRIEYIVLDDGSTDGTPDVLARYGSCIRWETHPNMGETRTVNRGFALARGDIVAVVNSDDPLLPEAVSEAVAFLEAHPDILVAYPDWNLIDQDSKVIEHIQVREYDYLYVVKRHRCIVGPGAFVRRRAIELAGLRDPSFKYVADFDFWLRVGLHGPFARIPRTLATFRVHPEEGKWRKSTYVCWSSSSPCRISPQRSTKRRMKRSVGRTTWPGFQRGRRAGQRGSTSSRRYVTTQEAS